MVSGMLTCLLSFFSFSFECSCMLAPILGSAPMAAERKILVVAAGARSTITRVSPYIKGVIARDMLHVASEAEKASLLKLIG